MTQFSLRSVEVGVWCDPHMPAAAIQVSVVHKVENAIHWINLYPVDSAIGFPNTYLLNSDLSGWLHYLTFEQSVPENVAIMWRFQ